MTAEPIAEETPDGADKGDDRFDDSDANPGSQSMPLKTDPVHY